MQPDSRGQQRPSGRSQLACPESNTIAAAARQLGEVANTDSRRAEAREIERHEVYWGTGWLRTGLMSLQSGDDVGSNAKETVTADNTKIAMAREEIVKDGERLASVFRNV